VIDAPASQFCPLCRGELRTTDGVRMHLVTDHKRSASEADQLMARFDTARPIPAPELKRHLFCAAGRKSAGGADSTRSSDW